ncbi:MAG: SpoIIE family protein phosphatase [Candidatus Krumholzibacteria bacterium]|nr:SpoIIE family protein phosphatase [Candidatus Krumholzibacteria bacterium]
MIRILRICLITIAILITVLEFFGIRDFSRAPYSGISHQSLVIRKVKQEGPNSDLMVDAGDRIIAVNGEFVHNVNHYKYLTYSNTDHMPQLYTLQRGDSLFELQVRHTPQPEKKLNRKFALMVVGFTFILLGFIVIMRRPDILGVLFATNFYIFSFLLTERPVTGVKLFHITGELFYDFLFIFLPAFFLHFALLFPGRTIDVGTRRARLIRTIYIPSTVLFILTFLLALMSFSGADVSLAIVIVALISIYWAVYIVLILVAFVRTYSASDKAQRVKFRIVVIGLALGIVPFAMVMVLKQFLPAESLPRAHLSAIFLVAIPISFAFSILKHGAMELDIMFRKGVTFAILAGLLVGLYFVIVNVLGDRFGHLLGVPRSFVTLITIILLALVFAPARTVIQISVDRLFYSSRKVFRDRVIEFNRSIQYLISVDEISDFVATEIRDICDASSVYLFMKEPGGNYALRGSYPREKRLALTSFPPDTALISLMKRKRLPQMIEFFDKLWMTNNLDRISRELISMGSVSVAVPMIEQTDLFGFVLVGPKNSGKPYKIDDAEVLELLGERSAAALRNVELYRDSLAKQKLEKELSLAAEIQLRLLPEKPPTLAGSEILGGLKTSMEVGGDFYDFVDLPSGKIGLAVADVSGKGIPAAMLMTTLQASFRAEAAIERTPAEILSSLNESLYERSDQTKFATFFYASYDDRTKLLHYANGGSFPPIVLSSDGRINKLQRGGTLVGISRESVYGEGIIKLKPGDIVAVYTDGIIDQENERQEPYGESSLIEFLRNNSHLSLNNIIEKLFATLLAFGQNNLKDDMTIVLLRNKAP